MSNKDPEKAKAYERRRYHENKEALLAKNKEWRRKNPEKVRAWRAKHKGRQTEIYRLWKFGITPAEYSALLARHEGRCGICLTTVPGGKGSWHLDHDHAFDAKDKRGHRGLLCSSCNRALGYFKDKLSVLKAAVDYLEDYLVLRAREERRVQRDVRSERAAMHNQENA